MEQNLENLYNARLLELAGDIPLSERLENPQATVKLTSPICGSRIIVDLDVEDGKVVRYGQTVRACTLGQAAASVMARHVLGATSQELRAERETVRKLLKEGKAPSEADWEEIALFAPAKDFKSRHGSVLLAFDAVAKALDEIESKSKAS